MKEPKKLLTNEFLELIREAKQLLLEKKQKNPFLFSKHISSPKKPLVKPSTKPSFHSFVPPSTVPLAKTSDSPTVSKAIATPSSSEESIKSTKKESSLLFHSLRTLIEKSCPAIRLTDKIPNDDEAVQRKNGWKRRDFNVEIILLSFTKDPREKLLIENIGKAICTLDKRCQTVDALNSEREKSWHSLLELPSLSFLIAPPLDTWQTPLLKTHIQLQPNAGKAFFGQAEVLFVPPFKQILLDASLKPKLWRLLCQKLVLHE
jgi:hypothetical protein